LRSQKARKVVKNQGEDFARLHEYRQFEGDNLENERKKSKIMRKKYKCKWGFGVGRARGFGVMNQRMNHME
jgi:hypothetical protein